MGKGSGGSYDENNDNYDDNINSTYYETPRAPHASFRTSTTLTSQQQLQNVGKGTIVFAGSLVGSKYAGTVPAGGGTTTTTTIMSCSSGDDVVVSSPPTNQQDYLLQQKHQLQKLQQHLSPHIHDHRHPTGKSVPQQQSQSSTTTNQRGTTMTSLHSYAASHPHQIYAGYGSVSQPQQPQHHHEFHYENPDYHDPFDKNHHGNNNNDEDDYLVKRQRRRYPKESCCARMCCLYRPIMNILRQENLHRSFCYGAIDGLLTGSGIVSAFWGLGILTVRTTWEIRSGVVALAAAACVADSLCMAMGHVWTTYVVTSHHAEERSQERELLEQNKADAKGKLVDMLLARGVLKIDAMSLADTLEGYPDLFVSALVGDSLLSASDDMMIDEDQTDDGHMYHMEAPVGGGGPAIHNEHLPNDPRESDGYFGSFGSWKFPSYSQLNSGHFDSELGQAQVACRESQKEGICMMFGFAIFAVVPSLLWLLLPLWIHGQPTGSSSATTTMSKSATQLHANTAFATSSASDSSLQQQHSELVSVPTLILLILSTLIWFLGVWKSRFVIDSNWIVFGMETIAVLLVCVFSAYSVAMFFVYSFGLESSSSDTMLPDSFSNHDL
jgi:hypothetical protein